MSNFYLKIILPSIVSILLFILTIFLVVIPSFQENIMDGKREMIKELTNSAWSILSKYESDEAKGILTREEAQETAISRIKYLRYGEESKDYFWITDMHPIMIIHPYRTDLNGTDLKNFSDPHGKLMFVEFVNTVTKSESGYVDYMWQWKDDSLKIVPKLSYVKLFKPWGWIIGTGVYIEDVKKEIKSLTRKLIWISTGISTLIVFLLFFISQQSLKIEQKRVKAERELHESKEKYKTLVEAATEGLIMLIDGKISFSNNVISEMTGYENAELLNLSLKELLSENNSKDLVETFSKTIINEGQYEINLKNKEGSFTEVLVTSSNALFYTRPVNILIFKDITSDKNSNFSVLEYQKLISSLNVGFFRAEIDTKGRFVFANDKTVRILGFDNFRELSEAHILELLASSYDKKNLKKSLLENGFLKNKTLKIYKKNRETAYVNITLVAIKDDNSKVNICDGIIEDITIQEKEKSETYDLIARLKSNSFLLDQPVKDYLTPVNIIDADATISDAITVFSIKKTDSLLIAKDEKKFIGIVTGSDIQKRVLHLKLQLDNPVYMIMSSPVIFIRENTSVIDAINICEDKKVNHLVVRDQTDEVTGILRAGDIYKILKNSLSFYISNIEKAETDDELKQSNRTLHLLLRPLIQSDIAVNYITSITSAVSDSTIERIIDLTIRDIGKPPVSFSFICLGSEGRKEETLYTDQDNAIIYEDVPAEEEGLVNEYFNKLGERVCNSLNYIGYSFCKGNIMAKNQQWCKPISVWEKYFTNWISTPEPQNLLDAIIFFDFRNIYGEEAFTDRLRSTIDNLVKERSSFLYHLAYNTVNTKPSKITSGNIKPDKGADILDLKNAVNPIIMFARTYSLQNNIWCSNTIERLHALKAKQIISEGTIDEILFGYNYLMKLRLRNQALLSADQQPLTNTINIKDLIEIEVSVLKKVLSLIPVYQNKISVDFRITA